MSTTQMNAQQTIADSVLRHTYSLIEALKDNYRQYAIRGHYAYLQKGESTDYHEACIAKLKAGHSDIDYVIETGKKYHKVIMVSSGNSRSVHCFIDKKTGEVYKSASWRGPAKGVRFDLRLIEDREWAFENADWAGGYLYAK